MELFIIVFILFILLIKILFLWICKFFKLVKLVFRICIWVVWFCICEVSMEFCIDRCMFVLFRWWIFLWRYWSFIVVNVGLGEVWVVGVGLKINFLLLWKLYIILYWVRMVRKIRRKDVIRSFDILWVKDYVLLFIICMWYR